VFCCCYVRFGLWVPVMVWELRFSVGVLTWGVAQVPTFGLIGFRWVG